MKVAGGDPALAATPAVGELSQREPVGEPYSTRQCPGSPNAPAAAPTAATAYHISCVSLYKATQRDVFKVHETTTDEAVRETAAAILSELWHEHLLERSIKDALVDRYYRPVLRQLHHPGRLVLDMQIQTSFPFPTNWVELRPGRRRNGVLEAEETNPIRNDTMSLNGPTMRLLETGLFRPGDRYSYDLELIERQGKVVIWRKVVRTNDVVAWPTAVPPRGPLPDEMALRELPIPPQPQAHARCRGLPAGYAVRPPTAETATFMECATHYASRQREIMSLHETAQSEDVRSTCAFILHHLWGSGHLEGGIMDRLIQRYYRLPLFELLGFGSLQIAVRPRTAFPFPSTFVDFTPTRYRNGSVEWAPGRSQTSHAMAHSSTTVTSLGGGRHNPGDTFFYEIELAQPSMSGPPQWQIMLRTNPVVVR